MFTNILYSTLCPWFCTFELALLDPEPVGSRTYLAKSGSDDSLRNLNDKKVLEILTQKLNKNYNFCSQNNLFSLPSPKGTQIGKFFRTNKYRVGSGSWCLGNCYPDPAIKEINLIWPLVFVLCPQRYDLMIFYIIFAECTRDEKTRRINCYECPHYR